MRQASPHVHLPTPPLRLFCPASALAAHLSSPTPYPPLCISAAPPLPDGAGESDGAARRGQLGTATGTAWHCAGFAPPALADTVSAGV